MAFKKEGLTPNQERKVNHKGDSKIMRIWGLFEGLFSLNLQKWAVLGPDQVLMDLFISW